MYRWFWHFIALWLNLDFNWTHLVVWAMMICGWNREAPWSNREEPVTSTCILTRPPLGPRNRRGPDNRSDTSECERWRTRVIEKDGLSWTSTRQRGSGGGEGHGSRGVFKVMLIATDVQRAFGPPCSVREEEEEEAWATDGGWGGGGAGVDL